MGDATVIELLDREWAILAESPATSAALRRWGSGDEVLARFGRMADLVAYVERRATDARARDDVLGALGVRADGDELAARTLLQLLLPGAKAIVARYRWSAESADELAAAVVADLYERLRGLPPVRRPYLAPAVLLDVAKRAQRRSARARRQDAARLDEVDVEAAYHDRLVDAELEADDLLRWAVANGHLSAPDAELIRLTRVADVPVTELSAATGRDPQTLRQRRLRAERALAAAVRAA